MVRFTTSSHKPHLLPVVIISIGNLTVCYQLENVVNRTLHLCFYCPYFCPLSVSHSIAVPSLVQESTVLYGTSGTYHVGFWEQRPPDLFFPKRSYLVSSTNILWLATCCLGHILGDIFYKCYEVESTPVSDSDRLLYLDVLL